MILRTFPSLDFLTIVLAVPPVIDRVLVRYSFGIPLGHGANMLV
jgi:hypothetical protein